MCIYRCTRASAYVCIKVLHIDPRTRKGIWNSYVTMRVNKKNLGCKGTQIHTQPRALSRARAHTHHTHTHDLHENQTTLTVIHIYPNLRIT